MRLMATCPWQLQTVNRQSPTHSALLALSFVLSACFASAADWPQFRGPNRDGIAAELPTTLAEPKLVWSKPLAGENHAGIAATGARVVLCDHGDGQDYVRCFAAGNGELLWSYAMPNKEEMSNNASPRATPLLHDGKVYVQTALGRLVCLKLDDGKLVWETDFIKQYGGEIPNWGFCAAPLIADGKLIASPLGKLIGLVALDPETGKPVWETACKGSRHGSYIAGTFGGVMQLVGYDEENIAGFELASGKRLWAIEPEVANDFCVGTPVAVGDKLLYSTDANETRLFAFEAGGIARKEPVAKSGRLLPDMGTPVHWDGSIYGSGPDFVCLNAADLTLRWSDAKEKSLQALTFIIAAGGRLLVFREDGTAALIEANPKELRILGRAKLCDKTWSHPALTNGRLFVRDAKQLYCYEFK
jgi:outer membrane protein assembly factor BamB